MASNEHLFDGVNHIVEVNSDVGESCEHCNFYIGLDKFAKSVNHYITEHDYKLLHIGTRTTEGPKGEPWHTTVAILGK